MEQNSLTTSQVTYITAAPSYRRRIAQEKLRQQQEVQEAMQQYYAENPNLEVTKKLATAAALGLRVIEGEKQ